MLAYPPTSWSHIMSMILGFTLDLHIYLEPPSLHTSMLLPPELLTMVVVQSVCNGDRYQIERAERRDNAADAIAACMPEN